MQSSVKKFKTLINKFTIRLKNNYFDSKLYWEQRYKAGGLSGSGSYNQLADFKAKCINDIISKNDFQSVIEFGVGDGNQLSLVNCKRYLGFDVSATAIKICIEKFKNDPTKSFLIYDTTCFEDPAAFIRADVVLSLDVLYHLVEEEVYKKCIDDIFSVGEKMVVIYSTNELLPQFGGHEKHRIFTEDIKKYVNGWQLFKVIDNEYSIEKYGEERGSRANFYLYTKDNAKS